MFLKHFKSERGYSLLLTIAVVVLFTVLGLSLMSLTTSGIAKNSNRQNSIQAQDLADKGVTYVVNDIQKHLEKSLTKNGNGQGLSKKDFGDLLKTAIDNNTKIQCPDYFELPGEGGSKTQVCIEDIRMVSSNEKDMFKRIVTFKSTGFVKNKEFVTHSEVILGTDAVPDQLRYAVSTNNGGNLYFHGGVEIQGDIKSSKNIIINKYAHWISSDTTKWENSVPLKIIADTKSATPKIILTNPLNKIYYFEKNTGSYTDYNYTFDSSNKSLKKVMAHTDTNSINTLRQTLFNTPNVSFIAKEIGADSINISEKISNVFASSSPKVQYEGLSIKNPGHSTASYPKDKVVLIAKTEYECEWKFFGYCHEPKPKMEKSNLTINGANQSISLSGSYYVNGDVTIENVQLKSDAILYVKGNVTINESTLNGKDANSTLIVFATGEIKISNISEYETTPSTIKGFFYTQSDMLMYGVGSNIQLTGGLSAKNLRLTALRGNTRKVKSVLTPDTNQTTTNSRLKIIYDENLIQQYTTFKRDDEEEFITQINEPEVLNRY